MEAERERDDEMKKRWKGRKRQMIDSKKGRGRYEEGSSDLGLEEVKDERKEWGGGMEDEMKKR